MLPNEFEWYTHLERPIAMFSVEDESETEKRARESPTDTIASLEVEEKDPNSAVCTLFPLESQCGFMWATLTLHVFILNRKRLEPDVPPKPLLPLPSTFLPPH
jgi:hypothetical protein